MIDDAPVVDIPVMHEAAVGPVRGGFGHPSYPASDTTEHPRAAAITQEERAAQWQRHAYRPWCIKA